MKKKTLAPLLAFIICFFSVLPVFAVTPRPLHIIDDLGLFSEAEFDELEADASSIENTYGYYIMFCITQSVEDADIYDYAQTQYASQTKLENGIVLAISTEDKLYSFYACGEAETIFTEDIQDDVLWKAYREPDSYFDGVKKYLEAAETQLKAAGVTSAADTEATDGNTDVTVDPNLPTERLLPLVVDRAGLLSDEEEQTLTARLEEISDRFTLDLAVVTVTDFGGKTPEAFADDFYDYNGYGRGENSDGALLVCKPGKQGNRWLQISTHGKAIEAFSDTDISNTIDSLKDYIVAEDYIGAFKAFADRSESEFESEFEPRVSPFWIPICLIIGFVIAFVIMKSQTRSLKSVRKKVDASDYTSGVNVTGRSDVFLYRNVSKTPIPKDTGSGGGGGGGGGSSTHTSSSGRTHGGGGASF